MKKFQILLCVILLLVLCTVTVYAADANVSVSSEEGYREEQVTFTVSVAETISNIESGSIIIDYDADTLTFVSGAWCVSNTFIAEITASTNDGVFACNTGASTGVSGALCTLTFNIKGDAPISTTDVSVTVGLQSIGGSNLTVINNAGTITVNCRHSFTEEKAEEQYLNTPADCTNPATYFKSCSICGAKGTESFESGTELGHEWSTTYSQNAQGHYRTCTRVNCGVDETPTPCSGGTATCSSLAVCTTCLNTHGTTLPHDFENGTWVTSDENDHWKKCADCPAEDTANKIPHNYTGYTSNSDGTHTGACACGRPHTESCAGGTSTCTTLATCAKCNTKYGTTAAHDFEHGAWINTDANDHWKKCADCTVEDTAHKTAHEYRVYSTNNDGTHTKSCVCGKVGGTEGCSGGSATCQEKAVCGYCGTAYGNIGEHNYDLTAWGYSSVDGHAHACKTSGCNAHDTVAAHTSSGAPTETAAELCTVCQYIITPALAHTTHIPQTEWSGDETHHWYECTGCSVQQLEKAEHVYDNTCDKDCNICGYTRNAEHDYASVKHNDTEHWYECACGEKTQNAAHTFGDNGSCSACGFKKAAPETDAPETNAPETNAPETDAPETDAPETDAPETDKPVTDGKDADITTVIIAIAAVAVVGGGITAAAVITVRKKRLNK